MTTLDLQKYKVATPALDLSRYKVEPASSPSSGGVASSIWSGLTQIASKPLPADISSAPSSIVTNPLKAIANFATFPVRVAKQGLYDAPKETGELIAESGGYKGFAKNLSGGISDTGAAINRGVFNTLKFIGNTAMGGVQAAIEKATGKKIAENEAQEAFDTVVEHLATKKGEDVLKVAEFVTKEVVERPENFLLLADQANEFFKARTQKNLKLSQRDFGPGGNTDNTIKSYDTYIKEGILDPSDVYQDPVTKVFKPEVARTVIQDAGQSLARRGYPELGVKLETSLDVNSLTPGKLISEATRLLDEASKNSGFTDIVAVGAKPAIELGKKAGDFVKSLVTKSEEQINTSILKSYEKGVKPNLPGKTTPKKLADYRENVIEGGKTIYANKDNLSFVDDTGDVIKGQKPETLQQFTDAIEQTKKSVFAKYDALAKEAGQAGLTIDLKPIASELDSVINNKAIKLSSPETAKYAESVKSRYLSEGSLDATTAQEVIQNYNKSLESFYRNPTYDSASKASIDAMVANRVRVALDEGISGLTGEQYQALKNQYGALKAMEKDVLKATLRDARKNVKGLVDFSDILSGGQVVSGILSLNPSLVASGATQKAIAQYIKYLNNPNRSIKQMFDLIEKDAQRIRPSSSQTPQPINPNTNVPINTITPKVSSAPKKSIVQRIKDTPNKQGGFARNPFVQDTKTGKMKGSQKAEPQQSVKDVLLKQRDEVAPRFMDLKPNDFLNEKGRINLDAYGEWEEIATKIDKRTDTAEDIRRASEILALLKR